MYVLKGYDAARLRAEMRVPNIRPGGKKIEPFPVVYWKDATEKEKETLCWFDSLLGKRAIRKYTEEEKEEIRLNKLFRIKETYKMLLTQYGWEYAEIFKESNKDKYGDILNEIYPRCEYSLDKQCNLFCNYYKEGKCSYYEN